MPTNRSALMKKRWAEMSAEEREARIAFLTGMWDENNARERMSTFMKELWSDYLDSPRSRQLLSAFSKGK